MEYTVFVEFAAYKNLAPGTYIIAGESLQWGRCGEIKKRFEDYCCSSFLKTNLGFSYLCCFDRVALYITFQTDA